MPGKTMIGGTAYDVKPGSVMVSGTVYTIKEGKTMVDGTAYSIKFASDVVVTITGNGLVELAFVEINGTKYTSAATVTVPAGIEIHCYAAYKSKVLKSGVYLNGERLKVKEYTFNADSDVSIALTVNIPSGVGMASITT